MGIIAYAFGGIGLFLLLDGAVLHLGVAAALPWFGLAVVYYLLFELLWRRYKKQVDQVMAEV